MAQPEYPQLASTLYDSFLGARGDVTYGLAPNVEYPNADQISTFGTIYLPRVYGLDLTSFEIASSGSVALTLNDVHSLDVTRDNAEQLISLATLCNERLNLQAGQVRYQLNTASNAHIFEIDGKDVFAVTANNVKVDGNLVITGIIDAQNITETSLLVEDKVIYLAVTSSNMNDLEDDGTVNNQAGIFVAGLPAGMPIASASNYEKSIRWNYGVDGTLSLGTTNVDNEAFWDVKGGALKLTHTKTDGSGNFVDDIAFRFRINERDELELVKHYTSGGNRQSRRVARFGLTTTI